MIKKLFHLIIFLCVLLVLSIAFFLGTAPGLKTTLMLVSEATGHAFKVENAQGQFLHEFTLDGLTYKNSFIEVTIKKLHINWKPSALFQNTIELHAFDLEGLHFQILKFPDSKKEEPTPAEEHFSLALPFNIKIDQGTVQDLDFQFIPHNPSALLIQDGLFSLTLAANTSKLHANIQAHNLAWSFPRQEAITVKNGSVILSGTLSNYHYVGAVQVHVPVLKSNIIAYSAGDGTLGNIDLSYIEGQLMDGHAQGQTKLYWNNGFGWEATVQGEHLNFGHYKKKLTSDLNIDFTSQGHIHGTSKMTFTLDRIKGTFADYPAEGYFSTVLENGDIKIAPSYLQLGKSSAKIQADLGTQWTGSWYVHFPHLASIFPELQGSLDTTGQLGGTWEAPLIDLTLNANQLNYQSISIKNIQTQAHVDFSDQTSSYFNALFNTIDTGHGMLDQLNLSGKGTLTQHLLTLMAKQNKMVLNIALEGSYTKPQWDGQLKIFSLKNSPLGNWGLQSPSKIMLAPNVVDLEPLCIASQPTQLCTHFNFTPTDMRGGLSIQKLDLQRLVNLFLKNTNAQGTLNAGVDFSHTQGQPWLGHATLNLTPGQIQQKLEQKTAVFKFGAANAIAELNESGLNSQFKWTLQNADELSGDINLPGFSPSDLDIKKQTLKAHLGLKLNALRNYITPFVSPKQLDLQSGQVQGLFAFDGTLGSPQISGDLELKNALLAIPSLNLLVKNLSFNVKGKDTTLQYTGTGTSGDGSFKLSGATNLLPPDFLTDLKIQGTNVTVSNTDIAKVNVSPDLSIEYKAPALRITGQVTIPSATIAPTDFSSTTELPPDVVFVGEREKVKKSLLSITSDVKVILGDKVNFSFKGMKAAITGAVEIHDTPTGVTTGNGEITVTHGSYKAYGQDLTVKNGKISFVGGPVTNPALDIEATRNVKILGTSVENNAPASQQTLVGVRINGTAEAPVATLFSIPGGLTQTQILSYLILGRGLDQSNSAADTTTLAQAAMALSLAGGALPDVQNKIKNTLGLSEMGVESEQEYSNKNTSSSPTVVQNTSLVLGKYLTTKLYVNISIGLAEPINTLNIAYQLSQHWKVQTETNNIGSGIDILYSIQRDCLRFVGCRSEPPAPATTSDHN